MLNSHFKDNRSSQHPKPSHARNSSYLTPSHLIQNLGHLTHTPPTHTPPAISRTPNTPLAFLFTSSHSTLNLSYFTDPCHLTYSQLSHLPRPSHTQARPFHTLSHSHTQQAISHGPAISHTIRKPLHTFSAISHTQTVSHSSSHSHTRSKSFHTLPAISHTSSHLT